MSEQTLKDVNRRLRNTVKISSGVHVLVGAIALFCVGCGKSDPPKPPPPDVEVVRVEQKDVPIWKEWIGTLDGLVNAQIRPQVTGYLLRQTYTDGAFVKKGQLLFEIDARTFQAALDQAKGQVANAEGQLATAQANQVKAQNDVTRYTPLAKEQAIPQQDLDNAIQANQAAQAQVQAARAGVEAAKAKVASAQLDVGFTKVVSLIDGIAAIAQAQIGDLVSQNTLLTTVSTVDPIKVYFPVSEREYLEYVKDQPDAAKRAAAEPQLQLQLVLADGSVYPQKGIFSFADRQVDVKTGTLRLQGIFPNPGNVLRPGQYARVRAITKTAKGALLVPQRAVTEQQGSYQVAVVTSGNTIEIRPVGVADRVGTQWIIENGLKPGERVVAEGIQKVRPGAIVNPKPLGVPAQLKAEPTAKSESR
ncbi:MAG TPA: efflux RND transporter periplasmic adaptor subunit [Blastocatellia bacterium]|nr:efflux RND transporter periplasmic adaptor subunit [Blastocatellia bacterium]